MEANSPNAKSSLRSVIQRLAFVMGGTIFFGLIVPALAAAFSGVFFLKNLKEKVKVKHPEVVYSWQQFQERQDSLRNLIKNTEYDIERSGWSESKINSLVRQKREYEKELDNRPLISFQPYYLHIVSYFWPIIFFCLSVVAFISQPSDVNRKQFLILASIIIALLIYIFAFALPLFVRTIYATTPDQGLVVYAFSNPDISLPSFVVQNINFLLLSFLLSVIWQQWVTFAFRCRQQVANILQIIDDDCEIDLSLLHDSSSLILRWQFVFVTVSIGFSIYSAIFWTQIVRVGDTRFMFEAIVGHFLWIVTIFLAALPLIITWRGWNARKSKIVDCILKKDWSGDNKYNDKLSVVRDLSPIGSWNAVATGITVVSSLLLPIVQAFIKSKFG